jgi:hypothetical protein
MRQQIVAMGEKDSPEVAKRFSWNALFSAASRDWKRFFLDEWPQAHADCVGEASRSRFACAVLIATKGMLFRGQDTRLSSGWIENICRKKHW